MRHPIARGGKLERRRCDRIIAPDIGRPLFEGVFGRRVAGSVDQPGQADRRSRRSAGHKCWPGGKRRPLHFERRRLWTTKMRRSPFTRCLSRPAQDPAAWCDPRSLRVRPATCVYIHQGHTVRRAIQSSTATGDRTAGAGPGRCRGDCLSTAGHNTRFLTPGTSCMLRGAAISSTSPSSGWIAKVKFTPLRETPARCITTPVFSPGRQAFG